MSLENEREDKALSAPGREAYLQGLGDLVAMRRKACDAARAEYITPEKLAKNPEAYRADFRALVGWPLGGDSCADPPHAALRGTVVETAEHVLERVRLQIMPELGLAGLLLTPKDGTARHKAVVFQHGGGGTPELCCDLHGENNYRHGPVRFARHGFAVFMPQLLLWNQAKEDEPCHPGYGGTPYSRNQIDAWLKQVDSSIASVETHAVLRALDWLETLPEIDASRGFGMAGLSYGGFYTLMAAAADTRIRASYSICFFNDLYRYAWPDFCWKGAGKRFLAAEIAALIAPRALYVEVGAQDGVFEIDTALAEWERLTPFFAAQGASGRLRLNVVDTNHKMDESDAGILFVKERLESTFE
ncbi:MAG TPA: CocE/NonD family hydrolase [Clostridia bacterium]|nr:CocE/NonD family hydrolase [Clostridia bacterium]